MRYHNMGLMQAYTLLKSKRSQAKPKTNFLQQLLKYEKKIKAETTQTITTVTNTSSSPNHNTTTTTTTDITTTTTITPTTDNSDTSPATAGASSTPAIEQTASPTDSTNLDTNHKRVATEDADQNGDSHEPKKRKTDDTTNATGSVPSNSDITKLPTTSPSSSTEPVIVAAPVAAKARNYGVMLPPHLQK